MIGLSFPTSNGETRTKCQIVKGGFQEVGSLSGEHANAK